MNERLLLVFNTTKEECVDFNGKYSMQIPSGRLVAFDSEMNTLYFGTDPIPCESSKFIELTSGISFNNVQIISKDDYILKYYEQLNQIHNLTSDPLIHDYGDIGYESGSSASRLMDLGIKFKIIRK